jgi:hypothetical protein
MALRFKSSPDMHSHFGMYRRAGRSPDPTPLQNGMAPRHRDICIGN